MMQTQTVPNITTDVGRHIIEEYIDEYDCYALDTMLRQAGAPCPDETGEKRFRVMQLVRNLKGHMQEQMSPVKRALNSMIPIQFVTDQSTLPSTLAI